MYFEEIDGERQLDFVRKFDYIREAGTEGERKAAASIQEELRSFGLESRLEEFPFEAFEIQEARFFITEPYQMGGIFAENLLHSPALSEWSEFGLQTES